MRHKIKTDRLGRFSSLRKATIKSLVRSLLISQRIITSKQKAKIARRAVEKVITLGKKNTLAARRRAFSLLCDHDLVKTLFNEIAPKFSNRNGGYTRIIPFRYQRGDNAQLVIFELTENYKEKLKKKPKEEKDKDKTVAKKQEAVHPKKEKLVTTKAEAIEEKEIQPKEKLQEKPIEAEVKETKEPLKEEPHVHPEEKPKKPESKRPKKFLGGFKGFFKKERDSL